LGNGAVPTTFNGPADSAGGHGSFQFGPIGPAANAKLELQAPEVGQLASTFDGFSFQYQIIVPVGANSGTQFYVNAYVDSADNGIGYFGAGSTSTGFYDCRYSFVASSSASGWNTYAVTDATTPNGSNNFRLTSCPATLAGFTDASQIEFFRLSAGDTSTSDNGLKGAFDLVTVSFNGNSTVYDFEPYQVASSKDQCKDGGWAALARANGSSFKNQGDCIQYVNTGK